MVEKQQNEKKKRENINEPEKSHIIKKTENSYKFGPAQNTKKRKVTFLKKVILVGIA